MSKHYACPIECTLLQLFRLIDIISLIVIAVIDSFHVHIPVINQIRQHISQNGWAIFISTYFSTISSKLDWGIFSICSTDDSRYITGANRKSPFAIFTVHMLPVKSYISPKSTLWISESASKEPGVSSSSLPLSNSQTAFFLLICSWTLSSSAESVIPKIFSSAMILLLIYTLKCVFQSVGRFIALRLTTSLLFWINLSKASTNTTLSSSEERKYSITSKIW